MAELQTQSSIEAPRRVFACMAAIAFALFAHRPLHHSDLWGHLAYGCLICDSQRLPATEPFMPLAADAPMKATAWLSQVSGYLVWLAGKTAGLRILHGLLIGLIVWFLQESIFERTRSLRCCCAGVIAFLCMAYDQICILRPQLAGVVCFSYLLGVAIKPKLGKADYIRVALLFVAWANLHPSFPAGLILLAIAVIGRAIDVLRASGAVSAIRYDEAVRQKVLLFVTATVSALANPYGISLFREVISVSSNPNLRDLLDWRPLSLATRQGQTATAIAICVGVVLLARKQRPTTTDFLAFLVTGAATLASSRMINWWAPITGVLVALSIQPRRDASLAFRPFVNRACSVLTLAAILFGVLGQRFLTRDTHFASETPVEVAEAAIRAAKGDLIWAPNTWGDYLVWISQGDVNVFATSHVHLIPHDAWTDYRTISTGGADALRVLADNNVSTVLVGRRRPTLVDLLTESEEWDRVKQTTRASLFVRVKKDRAQ